jgi:hypothetical protein
MGCIMGRNAERHWMAGRRIMKRIGTTLAMGVLACIIAGSSACSTATGPQTVPSARYGEMPSCSVPGHFCQTFFGP